MFSAILTLGSAALGLWSQKKESDAVRAAATTNQATMAQNKEAMKKEAEYQRWRTGVELGRLTDYKTKVMARQHSMFAKAGISIDSGTVQAVFDDTHEKYLMDREILKMEGQFNVERALAGAKSYDRQAAAYAREASNARTTGYLGMARTLLNVGGYAYDQGWLSFGG